MVKQNGFLLKLEGR